MTVGEIPSTHSAAPPRSERPRGELLGSGCLINVTNDGTIEMGKVKRGGYVFITWKGDHPPRHVHVYRDGVFVGKWDLEKREPMKGRFSRRIRKLMVELEEEKLL